MRREGSSGLRLWREGSSGIRMVREGSGLLSRSGVEGSVPSCAWMVLTKGVGRPVSSCACVVLDVGALFYELPPDTHTGSWMPCIVLCALNRCSGTHVGYAATRGEEQIELVGKQVASYALPTRCPILSGGSALPSTASQYALAGTGLQSAESSTEIWYAATRSRLGLGCIG
eukprot:3940650-Rhodomonas_salina.1